MPRPKIYLAGPISGVNAEQRHVWREELKAGFSDEFEFIDPADNVIAPGRSDFEVVQADAEAIRGADAVLAYMWRESIGTAFGILHAHSAGKIVVVCDPNFIGSRMVAFYADAVERTLHGSLNAIRTFFKMQQRIESVQKRDGRPEPFDREKLAASIRRACSAAGASDIVPARAIVAKSLGLLLQSDEDHRVLTTAEIQDAVWDAIADLASDPANETDYEAIRHAWEAFSSGQPARIEVAAPAPAVHDQPLRVAVRSQGTHRTIWGKNAIGRDAERIFHEMKRVEGIVEIVFGPFTNTHSPPVKPHVRLTASRTPYVIDGKCYDKGEYGTLQTFQVRVADPQGRDQVLDVLRRHLTSSGHMRPVEVR
jgi:nucleoside 2-deoxyribosyltransferase